MVGSLLAVVLYRIIKALESESLVTEDVEKVPMLHSQAASHIQPPSYADEHIPLRTLAVADLKRTSNKTRDPIADSTASHDSPQPVPIPTQRRSNPSSNISPGHFTRRETEGDISLHDSISQACGNRSRATSYGQYLALQRQKSHAKRWSVGGGGSSHRPNRAGSSLRRSSVGMGSEDVGGAGREEEHAELLR